MSRSSTGRTSARGAALRLVGQRALAGAAIAGLLVACGGRSVGPPPPPDGWLLVDAAVPRDAAPGRDAAVDAGPDAGLCTCPPGYVWARHDCTPTLELGCYASCQPGVTDCGADRECLACSAGSACDTEDCQAVCVRTTSSQALYAGALRLTANWGPADEAAMVRIVGFPFYIGALWWDVYLDDQLVTAQTTQVETCSIELGLPALAAGTYSIWVSQYGGLTPLVLAGFYTAGGSPPTCAQPGYPCTPGSCCATPTVSTACIFGRCQ